MQVLKRLNLSCLHVRALQHIKLIINVTSCFSFLQKKGEQPTGQQRRKHQITYLIHQVSAAKAKVMLFAFGWSKFCHLLMFHRWMYIRALTGLHLIFKTFSYYCPACFARIMHKKNTTLFNLKI